MMIANCLCNNLRFMLKLFHVIPETFWTFFFILVFCFGIFFVVVLLLSGVIIVHRPDLLEGFSIQCILPCQLSSNTGLQVKLDGCCFCQLCCSQPNVLRFPIVHKSAQVFGVLCPFFIVFCLFKILWGVF